MTSGCGPAYRRIYKPVRMTVWPPETGYSAAFLQLYQALKKRGYRYAHFDAAVAKGLATF